MPSQKLVRCEVGRAGSQERNIRFIPQEIFGMWKYLMEHRHGFEVDSEISSLWIELKEAGNLAKDELRVERVTELRLFVVNERDSILSEVCRYIPTAEIDQVRPVLLRHYRQASESKETEQHCREHQGVWFRPQFSSESAAIAGTARHTG